MELAGVLLPMLALGLLLALAQAADRQTDPALRYLVVGMVALIDLGAILLGGLLLLAGGIFAGQGAAMLDDLPPELAMPTLEMDSFAVAGATWGAVVIVLAFTGLLLLIPAVRRLVSRVQPIDPDRATHLVAWHCALLALGVSVAIALFLPAILEDPEGLETLAQGVGLAPIWGQNIGMVVLAAMGVGLFVKRDFRATLERLGLTLRIDLRWWLGVTGFALVSALFTDWLWGIVSPGNLEEVNRISEALFGPFIAYGIFGALTIGLAAGIGEEILFRGAAQPRLGLPLTAFLFAAVHTQYTISLALVHILVMGLLLGLVRRRTNTTTSIAVHATYNFTLAMMSLVESGEPLLPGI